MAGAGYDISASASESSSAATGAVKFGTVKVVNGTKKPLPAWAFLAALVLPFGFVVLGIYILVTRKK